MTAEDLERRLEAVPRRHLIQAAALSRAHACQRASEEFERLGGRRRQAEIASDVYELLDVLHMVWNGGGHQRTVHGSGGGR